MEQNIINFKNQNIRLLKYDKNNLEQQLFMADIENDKTISNYVYNIAQDLRNSINENVNFIGYIVKDISINKYVGLCTIRSQGYDRNSLSIEYAVHSDYRNSNNKYGSNILLNVTDLLFETENFSKAVLEISYENIPSKMAANRAGFTIDDDLCEVFHHEGYHYVAYSKHNPYYEYNRADKVKVK